MLRTLAASATFTALLTLSAAQAFAVDAGAISQESPDQWRASKLAGVSIYGPENKSVGKISDVLMSKAGKAEFVIVGVGGFLGIGEKNVAIPYDQVKFTDQPILPPANPAGFNNPMGGTAANGGVAPGSPAAGAMTPTTGVAPTQGIVGLGTPAERGGAAPGAEGAPGMPHSAAYPDHGVIDMTADQLKAAPAFKFAS